MRSYSRVSFAQLIGILVLGFTTSALAEGASSRVFTREVTQPGRAPYQVVLTLPGCSAIGLFPFDCFVELAPVPAGKLLVIQEVTATFRATSSGKYAKLSLDITQSGDQISLVRMVPLTLTNGVFEMDSISNVTADPGPLSLSIEIDNGSGFESVTITVSGYTLECKNPTCIPTVGG